LRGQQASQRQSAGCSEKLNIYYFKPYLGERGNIMASKDAHRDMKKFNNSPLFPIILIIAIIVAIVKAIFG
jgi:hypothetical protein